MKNVVLRVRGAAWATPFCLRSVLRALISPPVALALDVGTRILAEIGRSDHDELEALRAGFVASPRAGRDAYHVPFLELDHLIIELHPPAPAHGHVHFFLLLVHMTVR